MAAGLQKAGVRLQEYPDGIDIYGGRITAARVASAGDHRCAMSFAVLGMASSGTMEIEQSEFIATSYPGFSDDMQSIGAQLREGETT
jgi:3-phosphoshikimate 1-carboxyvinyltransferase